MRRFVKNLLSNFSHIYVENNAFGYQITDIVLEKFSNSTIVKIKHYKDVFNRLGQDFQSQKTSMKLILAKKREPFLYPASEMIQEYDTPNFYYNTPIINCLYNCDYCFLQGMYQSGNIVVFVNDGDFMDAITEQLKNLKYPFEKMFVSISYNTDLMAIENIIPLTSRWIQFASGKSNLKIEVRTKSAFFQSLKTIPPSKNVVLSWSLSPNSVSEKYEKRTPPLKSRLNSVKAAMQKGWEVRLCIDPIIMVDNYDQIYCEFIDELFSEIDGLRLKDVTLGVFRMNKDYFNRILKRDPKSDIYYNNYSVEDNTVMPANPLRKEAIQLVEEKLLEYIPKSKILSWK